LTNPEEYVNIHSLLPVVVSPSVMIGCSQVRRIMEETMDLYLDLDRSAGVPVVAVRGDIDVLSAPKLGERLQEVADEGHKEVHIDLSEVEYMDSEGIKVLIRLRNSLGEDGEVAIRGAKGPVLRVLQVSGLPRVFRITD